MISDLDMLAILEKGMIAAAEVLVERIKKGECSAADIGQLRAMYKDAGGTLTFGGRPTSVGDTVLESMADIDPTLLN